MTVYLSTGTGVFEVAQKLFDAVETKNRKVHALCTDNLAIAHMYWTRAMHSEALRRLRFSVLGGELNLQDGDIANAVHDEWDLSVAVLSAKKLNPSNGKISTFREPNTKKRFFDDMRARTMILPMTDDKFGAGGGKVVYDPSRPAKTRPEIYIVRTKHELPGEDEKFTKQMEKFGYRVKFAERRTEKKTAAK